MITQYKTQYERRDYINTTVAQVLHQLWLCGRVAEESCYMTSYLQFGTKHMGDSEVSWKKGPIRPKLRLLAIRLNTMFGISQPLHQHHKHTTPPPIRSIMTISCGGNVSPQQALKNEDEVNKVTPRGKPDTACEQSPEEHGR